MDSYSQQVVLIRELDEAGAQERRRREIEGEARKQGSQIECGLEAN
jgi:hypothetical protein